MTNLSPAALKKLTSLVPATPDVTTEDLPDGTTDIIVDGIVVGNVCTDCGDGVTKSYNVINGELTPIGDAPPLLYADIPAIAGLPTVIPADGSTVHTHCDPSLAIVGGFCTSSGHEVEHIDNEPGFATVTQRVIDPKTGDSQDFVWSVHHRAVSVGTTLYNVTDDVPVGTSNSAPLTPEVVMPDFGCPLVGSIRLSMQNNADGSPVGAPGEALSYRFRVNGGVWQTISPLGSLSSSLLGVNGAIGSTVQNQEIVIVGFRANITMQGGDTLQFGIAANSAFDPGESIQLQSVSGAFEYNEIRCEVK